MEIANAFLGKLEKPSAAELATALGSSAPLWNKLIEDVTADLGDLTQEWKAASVNKFGWSLRLQKKGRNIVYLSPCNGCFRVAFVLGDKAMKAARDAHLPAEVVNVLDTAPHYPEGTGLRLMVHHQSDLQAIRQLAKIKSAN